MEDDHSSNELIRNFLPTILNGQSEHVWGHVFLTLGEFEEAWVFVIS